jgi:hypothetical protein
MSALATSIDRIDVASDGDQVVGYPMLKFLDVGKSRVRYGARSRTTPARRA